MGLSKNTSRPGEDSGDDDRPQAPPMRPAVSPSESSTTTNVAAAASKSTVNQNQSKAEGGNGVGLTVGKAEMLAEGASRVGAVAVPGIGASEPPSIVSNMTPNAYQDSFQSRPISVGPAGRGPQAAVDQQTVPVRAQDQPIEATRVEDNESDIEAQVQARMKDQAKDIAEMVHKELITNMAVPVNVQPSCADDTTSSQNQQDPNTADETSGRKKRVCLISLALLAIVVAVAAGVGVAVSKKSTPGEDGGNVGSSPEQCSFCYDGSVPANLTSNVVTDGGKTCAEYMETQVQLESTDPGCIDGQAVAWGTCECPSLPPPPENPSCTPCEHGGMPPSKFCQDWVTYIAILGENAVYSCSRLVAAFIDGGCTCGEDVTSDEMAEFKTILEPVSGDTFEGFDSPQYKALDWIVNVDEMNLSVDDPVETIRARYVAAVLYYAFGGVDWSNEYGFLTEREICSWNEKSVGDGFQHGIICDSDDNVETLRLSGNNLDGSIPHELGYFSLLKQIDIADNAISGNLPNSLEDLTVLQYLNGTNNELVGSLPDFLFTHPALIHILFDNNTFSGPLSPSLGSSSTLTAFWVRDSSLTGTFPPSVGQSTVLESLNLHSSELSGTLPDFAIGSRLWRLWLGENNLVGPIPTTIGRLSILDRIFIQGNRFTGSFPTEISGCKLLKRSSFAFNSFSGDIGPLIDSLPPLLGSFDVESNDLSGTIPSSIGSLSLLDWFDVIGNSIRGPIPNEFGSLSRLEALLLSDNELSGTIPLSLANLTNLSRLQLDGNNITGDLDDAFCNNGVTYTYLIVNTCTDPFKHACECCTHCCNVDFCTQTT